VGACAISMSQLHMCMDACAHTETHTHTHSDVFKISSLTVIVVVKHILLFH
jgi:hypothetical protein